MGSVAAPETLGTRIRRARENKKWHDGDRERIGMSQAELARRIDRSVRAVNDWENDRALPKSSMGPLESELGSLSAQPGSAEPSYQDPRERRIYDALPDEPEAVREGMVIAFRILTAQQPGEQPRPAEPDEGRPA